MISIRLEASTICQLKCPTCITAREIIKQNLGAGFLDFNDFKKLVDDNLDLCHIELSNYGEIFLNPRLEDIIEYAYRKNILLTAGNGVNLNTVSERVLEKLIEYKFFAISCSIDGVKQESYEAYRRGGNLARVIENIKLINSYKARYRSVLPLLRWQFIPFSHNEKEIKAAKELAKKLGMGFYIKFNHDESYVLVRDRGSVAKEMKLSLASFNEYQKKYCKVYFKKHICGQLWYNPQINWDGRVLGCCGNFWGDFGNAFKSGLKNILRGEKINYARRMLMGKAPAKEGIVCTNCICYKYIRESSDWLTAFDIWRTPIIFRQACFRFIHSLGWKKAEKLLNIAGMFIRGAKISDN